MTGKPINRFTVFTKPWPDLSLKDLGRLVKRLGFDGVELPIRDGYQVTPATVGTMLKEAARILGEEGVAIGSVAGPTDRATVEACGTAGVKIIRVCEAIDMQVGYFESERKIRARYDGLLSALKSSRVGIGVQNHYGTMVGSAVGIMHLIEGYDPAQVSAVLDPAHCAVDGEPVEMAIDIAWSHLSLVNFKSASHRRTNRITAPEAEWEILWTTAQHSGFSWKSAVAQLKKRGYAKDICLPAEYSKPEGKGQLMGDDVVSFLNYDLAYIKHLFQQTGDSGSQEPFRLMDWQSAGEK